MKRILLLFVVLTFLFSCELEINRDITSDYLVDGIQNGTLDQIVQDQIVRLTGKPGVTEVSIENTGIDLWWYEHCFVLYVTTGTTPETTVSSAIIKLDGLEVLNASDFSKNRGQYSFEICNLCQTSVLTVEVMGKPGSYVNVWIAGKKSTANKGTFNDERDGKVYKWVKIGNQTWMAENLAYLPAVNNLSVYSLPDPYYYVNESYYYVNEYYGENVEEAKSTYNYAKYGVLYNWAAIMQGALSTNSLPSGVQGICPDGWHVPSIAEFDVLAELVDNDFGPYEKEVVWPEDEVGYTWPFIGNHLKTICEWDEGGNGTDDYGFSALPSGLCFMEFDPPGARTLFWTSSELSINHNNGRSVHFGYWTNWIALAANPKEFSFSCRCVKD